MKQQLADGPVISSAPPAPTHPSLADDLIWGVEAVAAEIGKTRRQTFHMIESGTLPAGKIGGRIVASRSKLRAHFETLLGGGGD